VTACAAAKEKGYGFGLSPAAIKLHLSALSHHYGEQGENFPRKHPALRNVMSTITRASHSTKIQVTPLSAADVIKMCSALSRADLRGARDRAILLLAFAGGLRRTEIVGLDRWHNDTADGSGWIELRERDAVIHLKSETGEWRRAMISQGTTPLTCPVDALRHWLRLSGTTRGPLFRAIAKGGRGISPNRLHDSYVRTLVRKLAGLVVSEEIKPRYSAHSLRAGFASTTKVNEQVVQQQLGYKSPAMIQKYRARKP
jgi:integrase